MLEKETKNRLQQLFENIVPRSEEALESKGKILYQIPNHVSLELVNDFLPQFKKNLENLSEDSFTDQISHTLVEATKIESSFLKARRIINEVREIFNQSSNQLISANQLEDGLLIVLNEDTLPDDFIFDAQIIYKTIIRTYCDEELIRAGLLFDNAEINIEVIQSKFPLLAEYARKEAFEQCCLNTFQKTPLSYEDPFMVNKIHEVHKINELISSPLSSNQIAFGYCSKDPLAPPKLPRYAQIMDPMDGINYSVVDSIHDKRAYKIPCTLAGHPVKIMVELWRGIILAEKMP